MQFIEIYPKNYRIYYDEIPLDNSRVYYGPWTMFPFWGMRKAGVLLFAPQFIDGVIGKIRDLVSPMMFPKLSKEEEYCILINAHFYYLMGDRLKENILKRTKNAYFVLFFSDKEAFFREYYKNFPGIEELKKNYTVLLTYNVIDAITHNMILNRPVFQALPVMSSFSMDKGKDVLFVGRNKNRIDKLHYVFEVCRRAGLSCDFTICDVDDKDLKYPDEINYNNPVDYSKIKGKIASAKCIVNLLQDGAEGITLRDYEAFGNDKYLITDNEYIKETDFYDPAQVIMLDELEKRVNEIGRDFSPTKSLMNIYSKEKWFDWLEETLKAHSEQCK